MSGKQHEICRLKKAFFIHKPYHHRAKDDPNHYYLFYSVNAAASIELNGAKMKLRKRQTLLIQAGCEVSVRPIDLKKGAQLIAACFVIDRIQASDRAALCAGEKPIFSLCEKIDPFLMVSDTNFIYALLIQILHEKHLASPRCEQICSNLFAVILYHLNEQIQSLTPSAADYARQIYRYIEAHYEHDISEAQLSESLGVSQSYLQKILRRYYHATFFEIVHRLRIRRACELLAQPGRTVSEIAYLCGFNSRQRFHFIFRKYMGVTPGQYQKTLCAHPSRPEASPAGP